MLILSITQTELDKLFTRLAINRSAVWPKNNKIMITPLISGLGMFPKISPKKNQVRYCTGYVEVITKRLEPHLNHAPRN